ncbi:hypothetical protein GA0115247_12095 [Streptomyces sp. PalvLS-984]|nr:hypothetical protein GA0115247_12095 [Streptomyces sp. PalvLS-984]
MTEGRRDPPADSGRLVGERDLTGVTRVTQTVLGVRDLTHFLQLTNLICAIALPFQAHPGPFGRSRPTPPGTHTNSPEQARSESHTAPRETDPSACSPPPRSATARPREATGPRGTRDRGRGAREGGRPTGARAGTSTGTRARGHKKDRAGPGGVQRDRTTCPASHRYDACWGRRPSCGAMSGAPAGWGTRSAPWMERCGCAATGVCQASLRCCGIPASSARTSASRYRRCPPSVRMDVSLPAFAQRVTVFGSTRNIVATSAGVSSGSASGVRAVMSGLLGRTEPSRFFPLNSAP